MTEIREAPAHLEAGTRRQQAVVPYLGLGFSKERLPKEVHQLLCEALERNLERLAPEVPGEYIRTTRPNTATALYYEDREVNSLVLEKLRPMHQAWSGQELVGTACYGIRIYQRGAYLYNHVDRIATHIISGTLCVDCSLEEPWPLYIEDEEGRPTEVSIEPGEIVFFEGARLKHGRPWPMKGDYYASMFVHYAPPDWDLTDADIERHHRELEP